MNMKSMMAQAKKMQAEMEKSQLELSKKEFKVEKQGATVIVMGNKRIKSININEILIDPEDKEMLEDLIVIAINEAFEQIDIANEALSSQTPSGMPF